MNIEDAADLLSRLTYKPGTKIELLRSPMECGAITIFIQMRAQDAEGSGGIAPIVNQRSLDEMRFAQMHESEFLRLIHYLVKDLEMHEIDEWLRVDGKPLTEPHPLQYKDREYVPRGRLQNLSAL